MAEPTTSQQSLDCEGRCCCRCHKCRGVGYWSAYDVTLPRIVAAANPPYQLWPNICNPYLPAAPTVYTLQQERIFAFSDIGDIFGFIPPTYGEPLYGSKGGGGVCRWSKYDTFDTGFFSSTVRRYIVYETQTDDTATISIAICVFEPVSLVPHFFGSVTWNATSGTCIDGGNAPWLSSFAFVNAPSQAYMILDNTYLVPFVPNSGASWRSCGANSDGSPVTDPGIGVESILTIMRDMAGPVVRIGLKSTPLPVLRPDRCGHLGKRTEHLAGCNGWQCRHSCDLGLPAVPGGYCQGCESYAVDPDYAGKGPMGWLQ